MGDVEQAGIAHPPHWNTGPWLFSDRVCVSQTPHPPPGQRQKINGHCCADHSLLVQVDTVWAGGQSPVSSDKMYKCSEHRRFKNKIQSLLIYFVCIRTILTQILSRRRRRDPTPTTNTHTHTHTHTFCQSPNMGRDYLNFNHLFLKLLVSTSCFHPYP